MEINRRIYRYNCVRKENISSYIINFYVLGFGSSIKWANYEILVAYDAATKLAIYRVCHRSIYRRSRLFGRLSSHRLKINAENSCARCAIIRVIPYWRWLFWRRGISKPRISMENQVILHSLSDLSCVVDHGAASVFQNITWNISSGVAYIGRASFDNSKYILSVTSSFN